MILIHFLLPSHVLLLESPKKYHGFVEVSRGVKSREDYLSVSSQIDNLQLIPDVILCLSGQAHVLYLNVEL